MQKNNSQFQILFVCTGNTCRSPMAKGLLEAKLHPYLRDKVRVLSAGTLGLINHPATPHAISVAAELGADINDHLSSGLSESLVADSDIIFCMAKEHRDYVISRYPAYRDNVFLLRDFAASDKLEDPDIFDPIGSRLPVYRECCKLIDTELNRILPYVVDLIEPRQETK